MTPGVSADADATAAAGYDRRVTTAASDKLTKGQRTRQRIFDAAFRLFGERGYQAVSLRDIAAEVGITHVTVLHYFSSKDELLAELMVHRDEIEREAAAAFLATDHEADAEYGGLHAPALRWMVHRLQVNAREQGAVPLFLKISTEASDPAHPAHEHFVARYRTLVELLAQGFEEEFSYLPADAVRVDARVAAEHLIAIADGLQIQSIYNADTNLIVDDVWQYLRLLGVVSTPPAP